MFIHIKLNTLNIKKGYGYIKIYVFIGKSTHMSEATKNTIKDLAKIFGGMGSLIAMMILIPEGSIAQHWLAGIMVAALILGVFWLTPLDNPIKRVIRQFQAKKKEEGK